jgi:hypothetical protein
MLGDWLTWFIEHALRVFAEAWSYCSSNQIMQATLLPIAMASAHQLWVSACALVRNVLLCSVDFDEYTTRDALHQHLRDANLDTTDCVVLVAGSDEPLPNKSSARLELRSHRVTPMLHIVPDLVPGSRSWVWVPGESAWRLPFVQIFTPGKTSTLWESLPTPIKTLAQSMFPTTHRNSGGGDMDNRGGGYGGYDRTTTVSSLRWNAHLIAKVVQDAVEADDERRNKHCDVRVVRGSSWKPLAKPRRALSSLVLCAEQRAMLSRVAQFRTRRLAFTKMNLPYQQFFLMWGPPGCGKTSFLQALAAEHRMPLFMLQMSDKSLDRERLRTLLNDTADRHCILALEDVESAFPREKSAEVLETERAAREARAEGNSEMMEAMAGMMAQQQGANGGGGALMPPAPQRIRARGQTVTARDFVKLMTGALAAQPSGRIVCLTTNHVDKLHPALVEFVEQGGGTRIEFPEAGLQMIRHQFLMFFKEDGDDAGCRTRPHMEETANTKKQAEQNQELGVDTPSELLQALWCDFESAFTRTFGAHKTFSCSAVLRYFMRFRDAPAETARRLELLAAAEVFSLREASDTGGGGMTAEEVEQRCQEHVDKNPAAAAAAPPPLPALAPTLRNVSWHPGPDANADAVSRRPRLSRGSTMRALSMRAVLSSLVQGEQLELYPGAGMPSMPRSMTSSA